MIEKIILGTYTRRESKGIYTIDLDTKRRISQPFISC